MEKIIHYCWFGPKPIPKLAKKCIASWQRFLPDYKIILWSEENVDLLECDFIKEAYEQKKYAFVADYVRTKVLYEYGGVYLDTDMEITKPIDDLLNEDFVIGVEDSGFIAAGLIIVKNKHNKYIKKMLDFYRKKSFKDIKDLFEISIPKVLTDIFKDEVDLSDTTKVIKKEKELAIYPREYFYPLSYDRKNNIFTDNTYSVHYYDASWLSYFEKRDIFLERKKLTKFRDFIIIPSTVFCFGALFLAKTKVIKIDDNTKKRYRDNIWSNKLIHRKEKIK